MTRVIRSEAELAQLQERPGFHTAEQYGGAVVNTDLPDGKASADHIYEPRKCPHCGGTVL